MKINWTALLGKIAGGSLAGVSPILGAFFPKQQVAATAIFGSSGLLVLVASSIYQSLQPAASIVADAPIVNPDGSPSGATNISSTSLLLPQNAPVPNPNVPPPTP